MQAEAEGDKLHVYAPNRFILDWVNEGYLGQPLGLLGERSEDQLPALPLLVSSKHSRAPCATIVPSQTRMAPPPPVVPPPVPVQPVSATPMAVPREELPLVTTAPGMSSNPYEPKGPSIDLLATAMSTGTAPAVRVEHNVQIEGALKYTSYLNHTFTFENLVEGKSSQLARTAT